jgi:hypothetical protein
VRGGADAKVGSMSTLTEILLVPGTRPKVVADCVRLVDEEVDSKGGFSGIAIKGAYMVVKAVKPGFIPEAIDHMLDDFVRRLEPFHTEAQQKNEPVGPFLNSRVEQVADALLAISDERAARAKNQTVKKAYEKLRPSAKKNVEAAIPRVGRLIAKYATTPPAPVA